MFGIIVARAAASNSIIPALVVVLAFARDNACKPRC